MASEEGPIVDIGDGSFVSSSQDPNRGIALHASATLGERVGAYDDNINNEYDINSERASEDMEVRLLVATESESVARRENSVLNKLNRAPRYFAFTEFDWPAYSGFSEDDDNGQKCAAKKGHKPCYICGDIDHSGNRCKKVNACTICSEMGHLVKDCPNKNGELDSAPTTCLRCGDTGHDMFSCTSNYDPEDLKAIKCYSCKQAGHLCCAENTGQAAKKASCYHCGESGHFGEECLKPDVVTFDIQLFCGRCKERGHSRKNCPKKAKVKKYGTATRAERRKHYNAPRRKIPKQTPAYNNDLNPNPNPNPT